MASQFIKGISVEITGDTTGLKKSLAEVDTSLKNTQFELNATNKLLKLDPKNTELLAQKQGLLKDAIQETSDKLKALNKVKQEFDAKGDLTEEQQKQFRELTRTIASTENQLKSLNDQADGMGTNFAKATTSALTFSDVLKANVLGNVISSGIKGIVSGLEKIASTFVDITKSGIEYNATMEQYATSFTAMLGSAEEADKAIQKIKDNASASPFDMASLVEANQMLLTTGETAEKTEKVINALGDAVAYTGGGNDELKRMASNLQQIKNVGKASATDIRQFAMAGIDVYGILADYLNTSVEGVKDLDISYQDLSEALIKASSESGKYYGAMQRQSETLNGQLNLIKSQWNELTGIIANDTTSALTNDFLPAVNQALDSMINWQESGFGSLGEAMGVGIGDMINVAIEKAPEILDAGLNMISAIADGLLETDKDGRTPLEKAMFTLADELTEFVMSSDFGTKLIKIGWEVAKGIVKGFWQGLLDSVAEVDMEAIQNAVDQYNRDMSGQASWQSGGFGDRMNYPSYQSSGFGGSSIVLNASFNMANTQLNENTARYLVNIMADEINNKLGGMI